MIRWLSWSALAGALACLILFAVRLGGVVSFAEPIQAQTSGAEYESLFAVWKYTQGLAVYNDRFQVPFNAPMFNWLFYASYGWVAKAVLGAGRLGDAWLPTVARLFTVLGAGAAGLAAAAAFRRAAGTGEPRLEAVAWAFAAFVAVGPLVGFWAMTVRPDAWALAFEAAAAAAFLVIYRRSPWAAVLSLAALAYAAWSFKQASVFAAGAAGLFLLARRDWRRLAALATALPLAWAATLVLGEPQYVKNVLFADYPLPFAGERMARNLLNFAVKSGPSLFLLAALAPVLAASPARRRESLADDPLLFALCGAAVAASISVPLSAQVGGSENYLFVLSFYLALLAVAGLATAARGGGAALQRMAAAGVAGWGTLAVAVLVVLAGVTGATGVRREHDANVAFKLCLDRLPRPLYVDNPYLALPWMTPGTEPFVLSYTYPAERALGRRYERDGIGGLIAARHFAALAVPGAEPPARIDGATLDGYAPAPGACPGISVFLRKAP